METFSEVLHGRVFRPHSYSSSSSSRDGEFHSNATGQFGGNTDDSRSNQDRIIDEEGLVENSLLGNGNTFDLEASKKEPLTLDGTVEEENDASSFDSEEKLNLRSVPIIISSSCSNTNLPCPPQSHSGETEPSVSSSGPSKKPSSSSSTSSSSSSISDVETNKYLLSDGTDSFEEDGKEVIRVNDSEDNQGDLGTNVIRKDSGSLDKTKFPSSNMEEVDGIIPHQSLSNPADEVEQEIIDEPVLYDQGVQNSGEPIEIAGSQQNTDLDPHDLVAAAQNNTDTLVDNASDPAPAALQNVSNTSNNSNLNSEEYEESYSTIISSTFSSSSSSSQSQAYGLSPKSFPLKRLRRKKTGSLSSSSDSKASLKPELQLVQAEPIEINIQPLFNEDIAPPQHRPILKPSISMATMTPIPVIGKDSRPLFWSLVRKTSTKDVTEKENVQRKELNIEPLDWPMIRPTKDDYIMKDGKFGMNGELLVETEEGSMVSAGFWGSVLSAHLPKSQSHRHHHSEPKAKEGKVEVWLTPEDAVGFSERSVYHIWGMKDRRLANFAGVKAALSTFKVVNPPLMHLAYLIDAFIVHL